MKSIFTLGAVAALGTLAAANTTDKAGSLLVFPSFDNTRATVHAITVTNTSADSTIGNVDVEFVYINEYDCQEFNRTRRLTPNDTLTVYTNLDNPNMTKGYVYVFAKSTTTGAAISHNHLAGASICVKSGEDPYEMAPVVFQAVGAQGAATDVDSDGLRDMNGVEYTKASDEILIPRFISAGGNSRPELALINLTGGADFTAIVDFLVYNDNEEVYSAQYSFRCYRRVALASINGAFTDSFLDSTNDATNEAWTLDGKDLEMGWYKMDGRIAFSSAASVSDPAILAAHFDKIGNWTAAALPYGVGEQANGDLVVLGIFPDNN
ncbi:MAG: hypothetical protein RL112_2471 [Planctomycetota bacterium]|jgi:hypothetical protein